jgi:hypothetical protein
VVNFSSSLDEGDLIAHVSWDEESWAEPAE